ncbi:MAG: hypothetical protein ACYC1M_11270 [Armatimonadota bacterium]
MKYHPLWTHTPAVAMIGYMVWWLSSENIPSRLPLIQKSGTSTVSAVGLFGGILLMAALYLVMSVFFDESWAKNEQPRKSFNWMSLFDEITIALLFGSVFWRTTSYTASELSWMVAGGAVVAGCLMELLRPYRAEPLVEELRTASPLAVKPGANWLFYQRQNPPYINNIIVVAVYYIYLSTASAQSGHFGLALMIIAIIGLLLSVWNGMRVSVSPSKISVRLGMFNWKLLELSPDQIASAEVAHFNPLRDFGGWGIRISRSKKGFFFEGNQGVLITPKKGMPVLIGSNQPQELLQAVQTAMGNTER